MNVSWMIAIAVVSFTIALTLIMLSTDAKYLVVGFSKGMKATTTGMDKMIAKGKRSRLGRVFVFTDEMIVSSNINMFFTYNILTHFIVCTLAAAASFNWINNHMNVFISFLFSILGFMMPYAALQLIAESMNYRIQRNSVDFLNILKNFLVSTGDIFTAFERLKDHAIEPLRTYVDILVFEYKHKIAPEHCFDNFAKKIANKELRLFVENLKIAYMNGSDMVLLIDEYINEIANLNDDSDTEDTNDKILSMGLYALLGLNFMVIAYMLNSSYSYEMTDTLLGQIVFVADIFISLYIIYMSLQKNE